MPADPVTLVRWEPWELNGGDCWRCTINTGHGELSWVTRHGPDADALSVGDLRVAMRELELRADHARSAGFPDAARRFEDRAARLRRAIEALGKAGA